MRGLYPTHQCLDCGLMFKSNSHDAHIVKCARCGLLDLQRLAHEAIKSGAVVVEKVPSGACGNDNIRYGSTP
jgi:predicted  nucleic acid-binding Zn-ribbon protein